MSWQPSLWFLAQANHTLAGACVVCLVALAGRPAWQGIVGILLFAAAKEFWADLTWLEKDSLLGSTIDFICYAAGALCAWLATIYLLPGILLGCLVLLALAFFSQIVWPG